MEPPKHIFALKDEQCSLNKKLKMLEDSNIRLFFRIYLDLTSSKNQYFGILVRNLKKKA